MSSPLANAIYKSGILDPNSLQEFRKWGTPFEVAETELGPPPETVEELVQNLHTALDSEGLVIEKVTDLEMIRQFLSTQTIGRLHVVVGTESADFDVPYGLTFLGEYIFPWKGEGVAEEMANGETYIQTADGEKVYFNGVREFYFGDQKAFMVCKKWG